MISNNAFEAIAALDLEPIKFKLMHKNFGEGWTLSQANATEVAYRRFLYLHSAFPEAGIVPTVEVDKFWHYHILDTMKYATDCEQAFGYFLHHNPYLGLLDDDAPDAEAGASQRTKSLYEATFGEPYLRAGTDVPCDGQASLTTYTLSGNPGAAVGSASPGSADASASTGSFGKGARSARCQATCLAFGPHTRMPASASSRPGIGLSSGRT